MTPQEVQELDESQRLNFTHRRAQWVVSHARQLQQRDDPGLLAPLTKAELVNTTRLMAAAMADYETDWAERLADQVATEVRRETIEILRSYANREMVTDHSFVEPHYVYELACPDSTISVTFNVVEEQPDGRPAD